MGCQVALICGALLAVCLPPGCQFAREGWAAAVLAIFYQSYAEDEFDRTGHLPTDFSGARAYAIQHSEPASDYGPNRYRTLVNLHDRYAPRVTVSERSDRTLRGEVRLNGYFHRSATLEVEIRDRPDPSKPPH